MAVATSIVIALTALAPALGARLSGLLATFPVYAGILTVFAQRSAGAAAVPENCRGLKSSAIRGWSMFSGVATYSPVEMRRGISAVRPSRWVTMVFTAS